MRMWRRQRVMTLGAAVDAYGGEMRRCGWTDNTLVRYGRQLANFAHEVGRDTRIDHVTVDDCRAYLDAFSDRGCEPATIALENTILRGLFKWLVEEETMLVSPMAKVKRPKVPPIADREVVTVSTEEVQRMLQAAESWPEKLCIAVLAFTGARRNAASELRWRDVDLERNVLLLREKGRKAIEKPIPAELLVVLHAFIEDHGMPGPADWVIPNRRHTGRATRSNKVVYCILKDVAKKAEVYAHCHAIRAAFAVRYLEANPGKAEALQQLMGHGNVATTFGYLRRLDRAVAMQSVVSLSFTSNADLEGELVHHA